MNKRKLWTIVVASIVCLMLPLFSACAEFLVSEGEREASASLWTRLFGVEEAPAAETDAALEAKYGSALTELLDGSVIDAVNHFARLGKYRDSVKLTDYARAWLSYLRGDLQTARDGFIALEDFGDAAYRVRLCETMAVHRVYQSGQFGYADAKGQTVIAPAYDWAERVFREESRLGGHGEESLRPVAVVFEGTTKEEDGELLPDAGKYGLVGLDGALVAPVRYDEVVWTQNGLAALREGESYALYNLVTGAVVGEGYEDVKEYREGYVPVRQGGKWGFVNAAGQQVPGGFAWDDAEPFSEGLAVVAQNKQYGFINTAGEVKIPLQYQKAHAFGQGLAGVRWGRRYGFINAGGEVVIKNTFADTGVFSQGACKVKKGEQWGLINLDGTLITKYRYREIGDFDVVYHRAWMRYNQVWGLLSPDGTVVLAPAWGSYTPFGANGMSRVSYRKKYGYIDPMGVMLISNLYQAAAPFSGGYGAVLNESGQVEYLDRFSHGFSVDSEVPTEILCGFIEGRKHVTYRQTDALTGESVEAQRLAFRLYQADGTPITNWAE